MNKIFLQNSNFKETKALSTTRNENEPGSSCTTNSTTQFSTITNNGTEINIEFTSN